MPIDRGPKVPVPVNRRKFIPPEPDRGPDVDMDALMFEAERTTTGPEVSDQEIREWLRVQDEWSARHWEAARDLGMREPHEWAEYAPRAAQLVGPPPVRPYGRPYSGGVISSSPFWEDEEDDTVPLAETVAAQVADHPELAEEPGVQAAATESPPTGPTAEWAWLNEYL